MNFYPVYRLRRSNGSFSRIGSLLDTFPPSGGRSTPHALQQAKALFGQEPGDRILLGPRSVPVGGAGVPEEARHRIPGGLEDCA